MDPLVRRGGAGSGSRSAGVSLCRHRYWRGGVYLHVHAQAAGVGITPGFSAVTIGCGAACRLSTEV